MATSLAPLPTGTVGTVFESSADDRVYTDGACSGNPGPGGWAWAIAPDGSPITAPAVRRTPRTSAWRSRRCSRPCGCWARTGSDRIVTDSTYVVNCFRDLVVGGLAAGLEELQEGAGGQQRSVEAAHRAGAAAGRISFRWVKGHCGDRMNDLVDRLAVVAAKGPFDRPSPSSTRPTTSRSSDVAVLTRGADSAVLPPCPVAFLAERGTVGRCPIHRSASEVEVARPGCRRGGGEVADHVFSRFRRRWDGVLGSRAWTSMV